MTTHRNQFDAFVTIAAVVTGLIVFCDNGYNDSNLVRLVVIARFLRVLRLVTHLPNFGTITAGD